MVFDSSVVFCYVSVFSCVLFYDSVVFCDVSVFSCVLFMIVLCFVMCVGSVLGVLCYIRVRYDMFC